MNMMHDTHYTCANIKGKEKLRTMTMITSCLEFLSSNQRIMLLECCCIKVSEGSSLLRDIKIMQFIHHNILMWKQHCVDEYGSHEKHRMIFQAHYPKVLSFIWWWWWCDNGVILIFKKRKTKKTSPDREKYVTSRTRKFNYLPAVSTFSKKKSIWH